MKYYDSQRILAPVKVNITVRLTNFRFTYSQTYTIKYASVSELTPPDLPELSRNIVKNLTMNIKGD